MKRIFVITLLMIFTGLFISFCSKNGNSPEENEQQYLDLSGAYLGQEPPGTTPVKFAEGIVSTDYVAHSAAIFSPDGTEVYWTAGITNPWRLRSFTVKLESGNWTSSDFASFSNSGCMPFYSIDGNRLYFTSLAPTEKSIYVMTKTENGWSDSEILGSPFISLDLGWQASITAEGDIYYCLQNGEYGFWDIYRSKLIDGEYTQPENLGENVNSEHYEGSPFISPDESYLIFSSMSRQGGAGGSDIYISFRNNDDTWTEAVNFRNNDINTTGDEAFPYVSPDGRYLFFVSYRDNSQDVYWVDASIIENYR